MQLTGSAVVQSPLASTLRCWRTVSSASKVPGLRMYSLQKRHRTNKCGAFVDGRHEQAPAATINFTGSEFSRKRLLLCGTARTPKCVRKKNELPTVLRKKGDRRTNKRTGRQKDGQHHRVKPPLCGEARLNNRTCKVWHRTCSRIVTLLARFKQFFAQANQQICNYDIKTAEQRTITQQYGDWYIGRWWVGCSSPLLAVPNATAHPSTASVPASWCGTIIAFAL